VEGGAASGGPSALSSASSPKSPAPSLEVEVGGDIAGFGATAPLRRPKWVMDVMPAVAMRLTVRTPRPIGGLGSYFLARCSRHPPLVLPPPSQ
jgi:hypothetical protein